VRLLADRLRPRLPSITVHGRTLRFVTTDAGCDLAEALTAAREGGWRVTHLTTRPRTLEDVFIRLTGRGLRE
jgi:hypothetical protein